MTSDKIPAIRPNPSTAKLSLSAVVAQSNPIAPNCNIVELCSDVDCWFVIGQPNPTATTSSTYLPAKTPRLYACNNGDRISAIAGGAGNLYITQGY